MSIKENDVKIMFSRIAKRYDLLNHLLSFGVDKFWRRKVAEELNFNEGILLDICAGSGDMALVFNHSVKKILCDFCYPLLKIAEKKLQKGNHSFLLIEGNALKLPIQDESIDVITIAFGLRNLLDIDKALIEFHRVLKKQGRIAILEFTMPKNKLISFAYRIYLKYFIPVIGGIVSRNYEAYKYLQSSIQEFPKYEELIEKMKKNSFGESYYKIFTFGVATLYVGKKL